MYIPGTFMCLSFHIKKHLKIGKGGMILCDSEEAAKWFKARRYEGRTDGLKYHEDMIDEEGWNMYMTPEQAARGLTLMQNYPEHMPDIPENPPYIHLYTSARLRMSNKYPMLVRYTMFFLFFCLIYYC